MAIEGSYRGSNLAACSRSSSLPLKGRHMWQGERAPFASTSTLNDTSASSVLVATTIAEWVTLVLVLIVFSCFIFDLEEHEFEARVLMHFLHNDFLTLTCDPLKLTVSTHRPSLCMIFVVISSVVFFMYELDNGLYWIMMCKAVLYSYLLLWFKGYLYECMFSLVQIFKRVLHEFICDVRVSYIYIVINTHNL